jgi:hypothetical protein
MTGALAFEEATMARVRAKFRCYENEDGSVGLAAVVPQEPASEEDIEFWKATPYGEIDLVVDSLAKEFFVAGQEYYVEFTPVE